MATPSAASYDWIREIKPDLKNLDEIPLTGASPSFPWDELASRLAQSFDRENIQIRPGEIEWRVKDQLYEGLGDSPFPLTFAIPSLRGNAYWVMPEQEMAVLESLLLTKETHPVTFQDRELSESFYRFLALEILYNITQINFDKTIAPILTSQTALPEEDSLCLDISLMIQQQTLWGRLIISPELRRSWVEHFSKNHPSPLAQELSQKIDIIVHLEAGKTEMTLQDWSSVNLGDFITLDSCSLTEDFNGRLMLTVNGKKMFRGKLKDGNVKILEFPLCHEVDALMGQENEEDENDDFSDFDELDTEDEDLEDTFTDTEDEELFSETENETQEEPPQEGSQEEKTVSTAPLQEKPISLEEIPISLVVEIGRIQMTVEKLLQLEPGNLLDLDRRPENGVDLVINGKQVGKGELIKIGESLGIRDLELGSKHHS